MTCRSAVALAVWSLILLHAPDVRAEAGERLRVLYLTQSEGFVHETVRRPPDGLAPSELAMMAMALDSQAFTVTFSQDAREITPARLDSIDVLVFSTTGALPITRENWTAVTQWVETGRGGFIGIHSAADTALDFEGGQETYRRFLGGTFAGHPWTEGTPIRLQNLDPTNPLASQWPDGVQFAEEIYQYEGFEPGRVRVLQRLDACFQPIRAPDGAPVTWIRRVGAGRLFYTNLGHTQTTWDDARFREQIVTAIRWVGSHLDVEDEPNPSEQTPEAYCQD